MLIFVSSLLVLNVEGKFIVFVKFEGGAFLPVLDQL
jgi:hypothetical protein